MYSFEPIYMECVVFMCFDPFESSKDRNLLSANEALCAVSDLKIPIAANLI